MQEVSIFTGPSKVTVAGDQNTIIRLVAEEDNPVTYSLSGDDSKKFNLDANTGLITFIEPPESGDYVFSATATDAEGNKATKAVTITISLVSSNPNIAESQIDIDAGNDDDYKKELSRYTRLQSTEVVLDHISGLVWQDNEAVETDKKTWESAKSYCASLVVDDESWRLPTSEELLNLVDYDYYNPTLDFEFKHVATVDPEATYIPNVHYWTSTPLAEYPSLIRSVSFEYGTEDTAEKEGDETLYVRCVKEGS
jgi:hypothetical protein